MTPDRRKSDLPARGLFTFQIVIEKAAEGDGYTAYSPTLTGCFRRASTVEEAKQSIREAVREDVEALLAKGETIPQFDRLLHVEELSISVDNLGRTG